MTGSRGQDPSETQTDETVHPLFLMARRFPIQAIVRRVDYADSTRGACHLHPPLSKRGF